MLLRTSWFMFLPDSPLIDVPLFSIDVLDIMLNFILFFELKGSTIKLCLSSTDIRLTKSMLCFFSES